MGLRYKIYPELELLVDVVEGETSFLQLKELFLKMAADHRFGSVKKVITDISNASFKVKLSEVDDFVKVIDLPIVDEEFKWAIRATRPLPTALSYLVSISPPFRNKLSIFSTIEGCSNYIGVPFTHEEMTGDDFVVLN